MERTDLKEKIHILQLPVAGIHTVGFLRGEFWVNTSNKVYIQITRVTFRIALFASGIMILLGMTLIFSRVSQHVSENNNSWKPTPYRYNR